VARVAGGKAGDLQVIVHQATSAFLINRLRASLHLVGGACETSKAAGLGSLTLERVSMIRQVVLQQLPTVRSIRLGQVWHCVVERN